MGRPLRAGPFSALITESSVLSLVSWERSNCGSAAFSGFPVSAQRSRRCALIGSWRQFIRPQLDIAPYVRIAFAATRDGRDKNETADAGGEPFNRRKVHKTHVP